MGIPRDKYTDNKLAEEFDFIVLLNDAHRFHGVEKGALGTLISAYTNKERPLYAAFEIGGKTQEEPLRLDEFRVLNLKRPDDLSIVTAYLKRLQRKKFTRFIQAHITGNNELSVHKK